MSRKRNAADERREREHKLLASVGFVKISKEEHQALLEAKADTILKQADDKLLAELKRHGEMLEKMQQELIQPRNDPEYLKRLEEAEDMRNQIANKLSQIDIVPDGNKSYLGVGSFKHHEARELALLLSRHFEAKIRQHE